MCFYHVSLSRLGEETRALKSRSNGEHKVLGVVETPSKRRSTFSKEARLVQKLWERREELRDCRTIIEEADSRQEVSFLAILAESFT